MGKITFILGGARSGKSSYALKLAKASAGKTAFIATCQGLDGEMRQRILKHKNSRPAGWKTFEAAVNVEGVLQKNAGKFDTVIIDCLTLFVSNLFLGGLSEKKIECKIKKAAARLKKIKANSFVVSNEVGLGIVPQNKLGRQFRDIAGRVNQAFAASADEVYFMVSGIPWRIK